MDINSKARTILYLICNFTTLCLGFFRDTFAIFQCGQPNRGPDSFTTNYINSANAVFTLHTDEILTIKVVRPPPDATTYTDYLRAHDVTIHRQPIEVSIALYFLKGFLRFLGSIYDEVRVCLYS